ncbi:NAD(P)/FAD-dependent oxidoreductase [Candidatus Woesearchaeota archaeon]|nr:NAD(P)/FAD-dependent oxidoreductase [Candidatus Woesearchaeota archaeon]
MNSLIIGAGPVGSYAASLLAKREEVSVIEEHPSVGAPVQCTGILTSDVFKFLPKDHDSIQNKVHDVRVFSPDGKPLELHFDKPDVIVDRTLFDKHFCERAQDAGASFRFRTRFLSFSGSKALIRDHSGKEKTLMFNQLIGADGPMSQVAKSAGILGKRKFFVGVQAVVKKKNDNFIDFYPKRYGFGWSVPVDEKTMRIGYAGLGSIHAEFQAMLKRYNGETLETQGGLIPVYNPRQLVKTGNVFLVGDAATLVKATTGGGLIPGLMSAELLAKSILNNDSYPSLVRRKIAPSLYINLKMRTMMDSFSEKDWNDLVADLDNEKSKKAFASINRDRLARLLVKTMISKPKIIRYAIKHFNALF